jgi:succinyl-CoA synthetase beta subunit
MKIHEYQGKELLRSLGVPVPQSRVVFSPHDARAAANELAKATGNPVVVVKSQIHAGGRGKGRFKEHPDLGGVKVVKTADDAVEYAEKMLGNTLVTIQTGPEGKKVQRLLIEQGMDIARELYLGITLDRVTGRTTIMASTEGGMDIEEVAAHQPEKILRESVDPAVGLQPFQARKLAFALGLAEPVAGRTVKFLQSLAAAYDKLDCSLLEVNPLVITGAGEVVALDAKVTFDDNAMYRHRDLEELRDPNEEDPSELEAKHVRPQLRQARRRDRLHGQRRRPGDGHHGHHPVRRRPPGQLPRRRRRRHGRARHRGLQDHHQATPT